jgi:hypothetical protein
VAGPQSGDSISLGREPQEHVAENVASPRSGRQTVVTMIDALDRNLCRPLRGAQLLWWRLSWGLRPRLLCFRLLRRLDEPSAGLAVVKGVDEGTGAGEIDWVGPEAVLFD